MSTFSGGVAGGFSGTSVDSANRYAGKQTTRTVITGQRFRVSFSLTNTSGDIPWFGVFDTTALTTSLVAPTIVPTAGTNTFEVTLLAGAASITPVFRFVNPGNVTISAFTMVPLGLLLAPDSNNSGAGLEWLDVSGNRAHIVLPTSGVAWSLPSSQQIVIEASTSTNGNQQLGGASLIDANKQWRIQSWTVNCSTGTPTISLGNVSAGTQYVSGAVMAAGNNDITLLARFPSTANLWANSSTTATLIHRITLVPAN